MVKFTIYVLGAYAIYYAFMIGLEFLRSPNKKEVKSSQSFSVEGAEDFQPTVIGESGLSSTAEGALKKN